MKSLREAILMIVGQGSQELTNLLGSVRLGELSGDVKAVLAVAGTVLAALAGRLLVALVVALVKAVVTVVLVAAVAGALYVGYRELGPVAGPDRVVAPAAGIPTIGPLAPR
jgi:hypothetical protein